jgi:hypothetical protein
VFEEAPEHNSLCVSPDFIFRRVLKGRITMKNRWIVSVVALLLLSAPVFALTIAEKVTPQWTKESGITVETNKRDDGTVGFTITRYLDKARSYPADSEWTTRRLAHLQLRNPAGMTLSTIVAGEEHKGTVVYWFALSREAINSTSFSLSEFVAYKDPDREPLLGGGTMYEFDLNEFAAPLFKPKLPEHP